MTSPWGFLGYVLLQMLAVCAMFAALCDVARRLFKLDDLLAFCAAVLRSACSAICRSGSPMRTTRCSAW